jgi:hypothetical protein
LGHEAESPSFQVIGVSRPNISGVNIGKSLDSRGRSWLSIIGRLMLGITPQQAEARLGVLIRSAPSESR